MPTLAVALLLAPVTLAEDSAPTAPPSIHRPLADPVVDADLELKAQRVSTWAEGRAHLLLLENNVSIALGTYGFRAERAVIRIDFENLPGRTVHHLSMFLQNAQPLRGRGPTQAEGRRLLVTAATTGSIHLETDLLSRQSAAGDPLAMEAADRTARYMAMLSGKPLDVPPGLPIDFARRPAPAHTAAAQLGRTAPADGTAPDPDAPFIPPPVAGTAVTADAGKILPTSGVVNFSADKIVFRRDGDQKSLVLIGHVRVVYLPTGGRRSMSLSADNAVVFLADRSDRDFVADNVAAREVDGVYLEDNVVATDGQLTIRAPRVFYDLTVDKAVVLDAVMYSWDIQREVPIYVRADKLMQQSRSSWTAENALLTTSEFAEPHFAIAARTVTVTQEPREDGSVANRFTARDTQLRVGKLPIFAWPKLSGEIQDVPLRSIDVAYSQNNGPLLRTRWDLFALSGQEAPEGVDALLNLDFLGKRGPGVGLDIDYDRGDTFGRLESYLLAYDQGEDRIGGRDRIDFDGDTRGYAQWQHRQMVGQWEASLEFAYVSDETFLEQFFREEAEEDKSYETSLYLKRQEQDWALTFLTRYDLNDFVAQTTTLQSPGYNVDKLPEIGYYRVGTTFWENRLTYFTENRVSRMRLRPGKDDPADRGFNAMLSMSLFGIPHTTNFDDALDAAGIEDGYIGRLDTRHEIQAPFKLSILDVTPYIAGRVTAYDDHPLEATTDDDHVRFWGTVGLRLHTEFSRTFSTVSSRLLDLHQLRHIIEPNLDVFWSDTSIDGRDLAVFDPDVEGINKGVGVKVGARNTLQTQRGGPGRYRTVDYLVTDSYFVFRGNENPHSNIIAHHFGYRPEYSLGGDHFFTDVMWMISDTLAAVGNITYDLEENQTAQWRLGFALDHSPQLTLYADYTEITPLSARYLNYGFDYRLTTKYTINFNHRLHLQQSGDRVIDVALIRDMPRWKMVLLARWDELDGDQTVGIAMIPQGFGSSRFQRPLLHRPLE